MRRRVFLVGSSLAVVAELGYIAQRNETRAAPPPLARIPGIGDALLFDMHTHVGPLGFHSRDHLREALCDGITGIAEINSNHTCTYAQLRNYLGAHELEPGLAAVTNGARTGYIVRAQEMQPSNHLLAVGAKRRIKHYSTPLSIVKAIHDADGVAVLCHPRGVNRGWPFEYGFVTPAERAAMEPLLAGSDRVDEVEAFNAQLVDLFPWYFNLSSANTWAQQLADAYGYKGIAASDTHIDLSQLRKAGIYVSAAPLSIRRLQDDIRQGRFQPAATNVSTGSFLLGHSTLKWRAKRMAQSRNEQ